jgi:hypothetical protein
MQCLRDLLFRGINNRAILAIIVLCCTSCGRRVDNTPIDKSEDLKAGYKFKSAREFEYAGKKWSIKNLRIIDTFSELERYVVTRSQPDFSLDLNTLKNRGDIEIDSGEKLFYGAASLDGDIVIFPDFLDWQDLGNGYFGVRNYVPEKHNSFWGVLFIRGEMVTNFQYDEVYRDTISKNIIGNVWQDSVRIYDTIYVGGNSTK